MAPPLLDPASPLSSCSTTRSTIAPPPSRRPSSADDNDETLIARAKNGAFDTKRTTTLAPKLTNFTKEAVVSYYPQPIPALKYLVHVGVGMTWASPYGICEDLPSFAQGESDVLSLLCCPSLFLPFFPSPLLLFSTSEAHEIIQMYSTKRPQRALPPPLPLLPRLTLKFSP